MSLQNMSLLSLCLLLSAFSILTVNARFECSGNDYWCGKSNSCQPSRAACDAAPNPCKGNRPLFCDYPSRTYKGRFYPPNHIYCGNQVCRNMLPRCVENQERCNGFYQGCSGGNGLVHFCAHSYQCVTSRHVCLSKEKGCRGGRGGIRATGGEYWCEKTDKCEISQQHCHPPPPLPPCKPNAIGYANWLSFEACQRCQKGEQSWPCDYNPARCTGNCGSLVGRNTYSGGNEYPMTPDNYPTVAGYQTRAPVPVGPPVGECKPNALGVTKWLTDANCKTCKDGEKYWPCKFNPPRCHGDCGPIVAAIAAAQK